MNDPYFSSIMIIIIIIMIMINHYCRIPALSWLSAGQLDGMNDSVLTQVSSYLLLRVCFNTLLLLLLLSSHVIDLYNVQHQHQNHHNRHQHHHHRHLFQHHQHVSAVDEHWEDLNLARNRPGQLRQHHRGHARQVPRQVEMSF